MKVFADYEKGMLQLALLPTHTELMVKPEVIQFRIAKHTLKDLVDFLTSINNRLIKTYEDCESEYDDHYQDYLAMIENFSISDTLSMIFVSKKHQSYLYVGGYGLSVNTESLDNIIFSLKKLMKD